MTDTEDHSDTDEDEKEELEYITKDPVKKWQFDYNRSTCFSDNYPEINYKDEVNNAHEVAPGEGKIPTNILQEKDWDLRAFPSLLPDGRNGLHEEKEVKLSEQSALKLVYNSLFNFIYKKFRRPLYPYSGETSDYRYEY